jgi:hypothetical protein
VIKRHDMDDELLEIVLRRLEESPLAEQATDLLLAAFESEDSLTAQLSGRGSVTAERRSAAAEPCAEKPEPAGAYLKSLTVSGFRGIGPPATLTLQPGHCSMSRPLCRCLAKSPRSRCWRSWSAPDRGSERRISRHRRVFASAWRHNCSQPAAASLVPNRTSHWSLGGGTVTRSPRRGLT